MRVGRAVTASVFILFSANALAEPSSARDAGAPKIEDDGLTQLGRLDAEARRAEVAARDAHARANALSTVARLAKAKLDAVTGAERAEAEEGLAYLQGHIQQVEASAKGEERAAIEYRATAERLRARVSRGESASVCDPPFSFDNDGRKRWKPECF